MCKAASIKALSDQTVTMTVSSSLTISTTEVSWDYENGWIGAQPSQIFKYLYPDSEAGTTSTCFGHRCPTGTNPLKPSPTPAPTSTYVPPPSPAVTQFTPAPSCLSDSNFWLVSTSCYLVVNRGFTSPPWLQCTNTMAGDPNVQQASCYAGSSELVSGTKYFYSACPAGYTVAYSRFDKPFDLPSFASSKTQTFEVEATRYGCCPSAFEDIKFALTDIPQTSTTVHDGFTYSLNLYPQPQCVASRISQLKDKTVTMGLFSDARIWDRKRQGATHGTTETVWDVAQDTLFAHAQGVGWTVFHGTHTCFEKCNEYFTYSYYNTDPNYVPPSTTSRNTQEVTTEGGSEGGASQTGGESPASTSSSAGAVAAMVRVDRQAGLSVVVVVVTVIHVAIGAFV